MTTKNLIPRASGEGGIGITDVTWGYGYYDTGNFNKGLFVSGHNITQVIAETVTQGGLGGEWERNVLDIYYNGGNVGIGTTNPGRLLHLSYNSALVYDSSQMQRDDVNIYTRNTNETNGCYSAIDFVAGVASAIIAGVRTSTGSSALTFGTTIAGSNDTTEKMRIDSDGNVGIGTTSPSAKLDIFGSSSSLKFTRDAGDRSAEMLYDGIKFLIKTPSGDRLSITDSSSNELLTVNPNDGNVGIGTTSPSSVLEVQGKQTYATSASNLLTSTTKSALRVRGSNDSSYSLWMGVDFNNAYPYIQGANGTGTAATPVLINPFGGNVGIGTTNPNTSLEVTGAHGSQFRISRDIHPDTQYCEISGGGASMVFKSVDSGPVNSNHTIFLFVSDDGTDELERMRIDAAGNVGIGTTDPFAQLQVSNSTAGLHQFQVKSEHTESGWGGLSTFTQKNGALSRSLVVGAYRPEVGVNSCALVQFQSRDGEQAFLWLDDSNSLRLGTSSATIGSASGTSLGTASASDERLKNIEDDFEYGLSHVLQLKPIAFTFKKDAQQVRKLGFGAQTSQSVVPESVYDSGNCIDGYDAHPEHEGMNVAKSDDNELGMEYVQLIPVLTKAIQEQQQLIEDLKSRIETLENK